MSEGRELTGLEIAIVGMAGRFPKAASVDELWRKIQAGEECIAFFSDEELLASGVDASALADPSYVRAGGVVEDIDRFDAAFFGYSPREAALLDPQQRLFLELAWTALEHAGHAPGTFDGAVGVYGGVGLNDYFLKHVAASRAPQRDEMAQVANDKDFLTTRISYKLNLHGPSLVVQTACSTSLVAIHLACQSLIAGECDMALAGGVTIRLPQKNGYLFQEGGITSPDGHCRAFAADAQGCVPGNGGALVVLRRLADAIADRDCIHAVIKGSATNNDGHRKIGYTAPSVEGQTRVIRSALQVAETPADTIGYLEAHGTGTVLGDPIEVQAATQAYRQDTDRTEYCAIGSIKSNVGHLDAGAGVTGFIKAALAVKDGVLPPTLNCAAPNPHVDFGRSPFYVNGRLQPWRADSVRRAGVSAFGIGGTNAHVILEEPPVAPRSTETRAHELLILSAKTASALDRSAADLAAFLDAHRDVGLGDVAFTLSSGRAAMSDRRAVVCDDVDDAIARLRTIAETHAATDGKPVRLVFMFPGQGAQYPGMARGLYASQPVFRRHVDAACDLIAPLIGADLRELLNADLTADAEARLRDTRLAQPAIFTVSYALAQLLIDWGLRPDAMIGHSIGEYVAACLAGVFSFDDALRLVCERGRLMGSVAPGAMVALALGAEDLEPLLPHGVAVAAINAPRLSVVSGPLGLVDDLVRELRRRDVEVRVLHTSHAFHSPMMEPVLDAFIARVRQVTLREPAIPYVSNLTGTWATRETATDPTYWARHLRHTVRFSDGLQTILEMPGARLVEVGPGQTLTTLAKRHRRDDVAPTVCATMRRAEDRTPDGRILLEAVGQLWASGSDVEWRHVQPTDARRLPLPTYPFERERFWLEPLASATTPPAASKRADLADWFSVPTWQRDPQRLPQFTNLPTHQLTNSLFLVFVDEHGLGDAIARALRSAARSVVTVVAGDRYERLAPDVVRIRPNVADDYRQLCAELAALGRPTLHVVHGWMVEPDEKVRQGSAALADYQSRGFYSLLFLAQALGAHSWLGACRVSVVSSQVYDVVGGEVLCPAKATIAGPCRVIPLEYERVECSHIDVTLPDAGSDARSSLVAQLLETLHEPARDVVAIRGRYRWRSVLAPMRLEPVDRLPIARGSVWLITGGTGGLGLALARHLWQTAQARLVLVGRTPLPSPSEWRQSPASSLDAEAAIAHVSSIESDLAPRVALAPMSDQPGWDATLDRLCTAYALGCLKRCGVDPAGAGSVDRRALIERCRVLPALTPLFDRMLRMLEEDGYLVLEGPSVRFTGRGDRIDAGELRRATGARYAQLAPIVDLLDNCASRLHEALTGRTPAIELLFGEAHHAIFKRGVENVRDHSYVPLCQGIVRELMARIAEAPRTRPLRILEVGGGEGLLTKSLLPLVEGRNVEYTFTDIGRSFVLAAERFAAEQGLTCLRFGTLDISKPPAAQGFAREHYDVVVAFNVIHATARIAESLTHVRELVTPGGLVVLQESVRPARWVDLVWGLTSGWWAFEDAPLRTVSPLLDLETWRTVVAESGFDLVTTAPALRAGSIVDTGVVIARKPIAASTPAQSCASQPVVRPKAGTTSRIDDAVAALEELEASGAEIEVVTADVADAASMRAAIDRARRRFGAVNGVIHAALVLDDGAMQEKTVESAERVFRPKVAGTLALREACAGLDLDHFVIFSSLVSRLGGRGQVDYCAASNFQDAFAIAEQGKVARSVVSIDWAAWREVGKAYRSAVERGAAPEDALPDGMSPSEGLDAFMRALASPHAQIIASPQDPNALAQARQRGRVAGAEQQVSAERSGGASDVEVLEASAPESPAQTESVTDTERVIAQIWQEVLGVPRVGVRDNFFDLGGDSVISLQFIAKAKKVGLTFTKGQVFEHQTIAELAAVVTGVAERGGSPVDGH